MAEFLKMKDVTKQFPGVLALDKVNFSLGEGEIHALVGANGAGKSTLIKTLAGVHTPDSGWIELKGEKSISGIQMMQRKTVLPLFIRSLRSSRIWTLQGIYILEKSR